MAARRLGPWWFDLRRLGEKKSLKVVGLPNWFSIKETTYECRSLRWLRL